MISPIGAKAPSLIDSPTAWLRLGVAVLLSTIGGVGMWSYMVALPAIQADFGVSRADASLPFTMVMFGFAGGGVLMGRLADRFGIALPLGIGLFCLITIMPLVFAMRARIEDHHSETAGAAARRQAEAPFSPLTLQILLCIAGIGCCVAMSMPQVHIVAYCGDLGYGVARGAEMLSLMLGFGIISRIASGFVADRIGGVRTLLIGSVLQGVALFLYLWFDGLISLYVISALFGLFQGGIVPSYAIIVREYFSPREAGARVGLVLMATLLGMALGGWMSGLIFDFTGSYRIAFLNCLAWNLVNVSIMTWLLQRSRRRPALA